MSIILFFFTQCTQAEAQLQAAERRIADILGKDTSSLQEGECFISVSFFDQMYVDTLLKVLEPYNSPPVW